MSSKYGSRDNPPSLISPKMANKFTHTFFIISILMILYGGTQHSDSILAIGYVVMFVNTMIDTFARRGPYVLKFIVALGVTVGSIYIFHMSQATADGIMHAFMNLITKYTSGLSK